MRGVCGEIGRRSNHPARDERGRRGAIQFIRGGLLVQTTALTPTLRAATVSPKQRENCPPLRGGSNALGRARGSALNRGAHSAWVVEFIGSSQAHGCFESCFPLTPALSLGERENLPPRLHQSRAPGLIAARDAVFPP